MGLFGRDGDRRPWADRFETRHLLWVLLALPVLIAVLALLPKGFWGGSGAGAQGQGSRWPGQGYNAQAPAQPRTARSIASSFIDLVRGAIGSKDAAVASRQGRIPGQEYAEEEGGMRLADAAAAGGQGGVDQAIAQLLAKRQSEAKGSPGSSPQGGGAAAAPARGGAKGDEEDEEGRFEGDSTLGRAPFGGQEAKGQRAGDGKLLLARAVSGGGRASGRGSRGPGLDPASRSPAFAATPGGTPATTSDGQPGGGPIPHRVDTERLGGGANPQLGGGAGGHGAIEAPEVGEAVPAKEDEPKIDSTVACNNLFTSCMQATQEYDRQIAMHTANLNSCYYYVSTEKGGMVRMVDQACYDRITKLINNATQDKADAKKECKVRQDEACKQPPK